MVVNSPPGPKCRIESFSEEMKSETSSRIVKSTRENDSFFSRMEMESPSREHTRPSIALTANNHDSRSLHWKNGMRETSVEEDEARDEQRRSCEEELGIAWARRESCSGFFLSSLVFRKVSVLLTAFLFSVLFVKIFFRSNSAFVRRFKFAVGFVSAWFRPRWLEPLDSCERSQLRKDNASLSYSPSNFSKEKRVRGVLCYLLLGASSSLSSDPHRDYPSEIALSISLLAKNARFLVEKNYTIAIFFDDDSRFQARMLEYHLDRSDQTGSLSIEFHLISIPFDSKAKAHRPIPSLVRCGNDCYDRYYVQMNIWRMFEMWNHPVFQKYDYYWSIDSDLYLVSPMSNDIFEEMRQNHYVYGYIWETEDPLECSPSEALHWYINCTGIKPKREIKAFESRTYYGNFQVGRIDFFRSFPYRHFSDFISRLRGVYTARWSDQVHFFQALSLFVDSQRLYQFIDLSRLFCHKRTNCRT